ncbi:Uncharacterised protein [Listeria fleischmannii subsp. fleischmannii]|uniref:Uncharacterized protein n=1 Tax=Listeria fleischmannii subsp. fleischmannii TaxID=1671902 RepID=A0A2X3HFI9_9LIST|nr:hypothetical protein [Listeria fleischmannii]SQC69415.1 Uncharacterised protein [Listeria fleischmannii subsp. fleischmannii]
MPKIIAPKIPSSLTPALEADFTDNYTKQTKFTGTFPIRETEQLVIDQSCFINVFFEANHYPKWI